MVNLSEFRSRVTFGFGLTRLQATFQLHFGNLKSCVKSGDFGPRLTMSMTPQDVA